MSKPNYDADLPGQVKRALTEFLAEAGQHIRAVEPEFAIGIDALANFVLGGGKRLRPQFAWWAWRGAGGDPAGEHAEGVVRAISSLELLQGCALIHDDLMDSSASRRGMPTVHVAFAKKHADHGWLGASAGYGQAVAILLGDLALTWSDDMFSSAPMPPEVLAAARPAWRAMRTEVLAGQYLDINTQALGDASPSAAMRVNQLKTAAYTVQRPLHLGAALAGADGELVDGLVELGGDLGIAFQLRDDLLGVFGDPSVTGKPAGDDLREGKRTLLVALGMERAASANRAHELAVISDAIGNPALTELDVDAVRHALTDVGAVAAVEREIERLTTKSLDALAQLGLAEPAATKLTDLAIQATTRTH